MPAGVQGDGCPTSRRAQVDGGGVSSGGGVAGCSLDGGGGVPSGPVGRGWSASGVGNEGSVIRQTILTLVGLGHGDRARRGRPQSAP
jgi:hypothetical protein